MVALQVRRLLSLNKTHIFAEWHVELNFSHVVHVEAAVRFAVHVAFAAKSPSLALRWRVAAHKNGHASS